MSSIRDFGAKGDGQTDDTAAFQHAVKKGDGGLTLPPGDYVIRRTIQVPLEKFGRFSLAGDGPAKFLWHGSGPLLHVIGTHQKSADPTHFVEAEWRKERMPILSGFEIEGAGPDSDGIRIEGVMQPTLSRLLIRRCRHGIHLFKRNRNVIISDCHIYDNRGIGVFLDRVNLHQINIHGNHISYCKRGGIVIAGSEVRNIQVCSNDIEYNYDVSEKQSADVWYDAREGTIREGTIVGNTIQAKFSPGGANVRFTGPAGRPEAIGMISVSNNLFGSQETLLHFQSCRGIAIGGNALYSGERYAILAENCEHLVFTGNSHDHNSDYKGKVTDAHLFRNCRNVTMTGCVIQHTGAAAIEVEASVEFQNCENVSVMGCQIINARKRGIRVQKCKAVRVSDCAIRGQLDAAILFDDESKPVMATNNFIAKADHGVQADAGKPAHLSGNSAVE